MVVKPTLHRVERRRVQVRHGADHGVAIGRAVGEQPAEQLVLNQAIGLVVVLPLLVLDDAALLVEHALRDRAGQPAHPIRFEKQRALQRPGRHRFEIVGAIEAGGAVVIGRADAFQRHEEVVGRVLAAVEHQMLEQVREAGAALGFEGGADIVPDADRDHRGLAVGVHDHAQAVGQRELLIGDVHLAHERGCGHGLVALREGGRGKRGGARAEQGETLGIHAICGPGRCSTQL